MHVDVILKPFVNVHTLLLFMAMNFYVYIFYIMWLFISLSEDVIYVFIHLCLHTAVNTSIPTYTSPTEDKWTLSSQ